MALSEGQILQLVAPEPTPLSQLHEIRGGIRAGTEDEDDGGERCALLKDGLEADDGRHHVLLPHDLGDVLGDGAVDAVDPEAPEQHQALEVCQRLFILHREPDRLRRVGVKPLQR